MTIIHISGKNAGKIMLYALSTCGWCKKTKNLLNTLGVQYDYTDVDLLTGEERENVMRIVNRWNPSGSFPTIVINNSQSILGFNEDEIRKALTA